MKASWLIMLLRLACLVATNAVALLRMLPMSDRDKDIEILALRHQLLILHRQVSTPAFTPTDRMLLAGLLHQLPGQQLRRLMLLVRRRRAIVNTCGWIFQALRNSSGRMGRPTWRMRRGPSGTPGS